jgi:hypothetical protein
MGFCHQGYSPNDANRAAKNRPLGLDCLSEDEKPGVRTLEDEEEVDGHFLVLPGFNFGPNA